MLTDYHAKLFAHELMKRCLLDSVENFAAALDTITEEMGEGEHLLICCKKSSVGCDTRHPNIQVKKISAMLMGRCEFGNEVANSKSQKIGNKNPNQQELF